MGTNCIFCDIIAGKEISYPIFENEHFIAFLDKRPLFPGHTLLCPKEHFETLYDLPAIQIEALFKLTQKIGKAVEQGMQATGSFIAINNKISQSVPHLHIHLVPRNHQDGLKGFFWPRKKYLSDQEIRETQKKITTELKKTRG